MDKLTEVFNPHVEEDDASLRSAMHVAGSVVSAAQRQAPDLEWRRHRCVQNLRDRLQRKVDAVLARQAKKRGKRGNITDAVGGAGNKQLYEEWQFRRTLHEFFTSGQGEGVRDPLIPFKGGVDEALVNELMALGADVEYARGVAAELDRAATKAVLTLERHRVNASAHAAISPAVGEPPICEVQFRSIKLPLRESHLNKLRFLFQRFGAPDERESEVAFADRLFCMLLRYATLSGLYTQGAGFQAAMMPSCFDVLLETMGVKFECFASPLNARYSRFCSAFYDVDWCFGSCGTFFSFRPTSGIFEANPPFEPVFIAAMLHHMESLLGATLEPLCFVVIVPTWKHSQAWKALSQSAFVVHHEVIPQREHGYLEGAQHMRKSKFRIATQDTSVMWLANEAGARKWSPTKQHLVRLREAFKSRHSEELPKKRKKREEDDEDEGATATKKKKPKQPRHGRKKKKSKGKRQ